MNEDIVLKKKKTNFLDKINELFRNKKKRYLYMFLFMLPFLIAIGIFSIIAFKEAKTLISLAKGETVVNEKHIISSANYTLRDNATEVQEQYFAELKDAIENGTTDDNTIAELVAKNFVADFYTWTNKAGQYDIGGISFVYNEEFEDGTESRTNVYQNARDGFYKYINNYIVQYGKENLLEVENVTASSVKQDKTFETSVHISYLQDENGEWYDERDYYDCDSYIVKCNWTYKFSDIFDTSKYPTSIYLRIINNRSRYEILQASSKEIKENKNEIEENEDIQEETEITETENSYR